MTVGAVCEQIEKLGKQCITNAAGEKQVPEFSAQECAMFAALQSVASGTLGLMCPSLAAQAGPESTADRDGPLEAGPEPTAEPDLSPEEREQIMCEHVAAMGKKCTPDPSGDFMTVEPALTAEECQKLEPIRSTVGATAFVHFCSESFAEGGMASPTSGPNDNLPGPVAGCEASSEAKSVDPADPAACKRKMMRSPEIELASGEWVACTDQDVLPGDLRVFNGDDEKANEGLKAYCEAALYAQNQTYGHLGWYGADGNGAAVKMRYFMPSDHPGWDAASSGGTIYVRDDGKTNGKTTFLHEYTHIVQAATGGGQWSGPDTIAVSEGLAQIAEMEDELRDSNPVYGLKHPGAFPQPYVEVKASDDAHKQAVVLEAAASDVAYGFANGKLSWDWQKEARVRQLAMQRYLPQGELSFGAVRDAYIAAAKDLGLDPKVVEDAFANQGIVDGSTTLATRVKPDKAIGTKHPAPPRGPGDGAGTRR